ncbi:multicopper oxidase-domain-containing protein [Lipomyces doorenjongii]|uniref:multicopper oxidase-domain-containing protein n=1 Tax=Lipomyces doorenjongii TaxID=383834 RepID=UPI0034CD9CC9
MSCQRCDGIDLYHPHYTGNTDERVREFTFDVARHVLSYPDGVAKSMVLVNRLFPGPTIRANKGDTLNVHVNNHLNESTSLHFHGLHQRGTNSMDGVPGVTQCGIPPGQSFTYRIILSQSGTFWWHSHSSTQPIDGMAGAMVVHSVFAGFHASGEDMFNWYLSRSSAGFEPVPDNGLVNGRAFRDVCSRTHELYPCSSIEDVKSTQFNFVRGKKYRLRVINAAALAEITFSLDRHVLRVVEADSSETEPTDIHFAPIAPGQRYSFIVTAEASGPVSQVTLRADMNTNCFNYRNPTLDPEIRALVNLVDDSSSIVKRATIWLRSLVPGKLRAESLRWDDFLLPEFCRDLDPNLLVPVSVGSHSGPVPPFDYRVQVWTKTLKLERVNLAPFGFINRTSFMPAIGAPNLHVAFGLVDAAATAPMPTVGGKKNTETLGGDQLVVPISMKNDEKSQVIELIIHNPDESAHPFHLHGHDMWLIRAFSGDAGLGGWKPEFEAEYVVENVVPRDTIVVPRLGHAVVRFRVSTDNPGILAFHCHILWHLRAGMMMQFAVGLDKLDEKMVTSEMRQHCNIERELGDNLLVPLPGDEFRKGMIPPT